MIELGRIRITWSTIYKTCSKDSVMVSVSDWTRRVNAIMTSEYAITLDDVGLDASDIHRYRQSEADPHEFVRWFARKYDLLGAAEIGVRPAKRK